MKRLLVSLLAVAVVTPAVWGGEIRFGDKNAGRSAVVLSEDSVADASRPEISFEARVTNLVASEVQTPRGTFTSLSIPGYQHSETIGAPALPVMNALVEVPLGAKLYANGVRRDVKRVSLKDLDVQAPVMPRQPPHPKDGSEVPFAYEAAAYRAEGMLQDDLVSVEDLGILRDRRLALVKIAPVAYDATGGTLEVATRIEVSLSLKGADMKATEALKRTYASPYFDAIAASVLTPSSLKSLQSGSLNSPVCFAVVADRQFEDALRPYLEWKTSKGFHVVTAYTDEVGVDSSAIRTWVHNLYANPEPDRAAPTFLLIVGDVQQVPPFQGRSGRHVTDLNYVCTTGDDLLPDILTGRFSAQTPEQLAPQLAKTLEYEKFQMADPSFLKDLVLIAGWDYSHAVEWGWPQINYGTKYYYNAEHGFDEVNVFLSAGSSQNESEIHSRVSAGAAFVNYTAHGSQTSWADPSFTRSDIDALQNAGKYPLMVGNCCVTNSFQIDTCFGEALLRAENKGALGYIGGSNNTYWDEDLWWGNGFYAIQHPNQEGAAPNREDTGPGAYDTQFDGSHPTAAGMNLAGNLAVQASNTSRKAYYWEIYHLMGDPSLAVYWGVPSKPSIQHGESVSLQSAEFEVKAPAGSLVGVSQNGKLLGSGFADGSGSVRLALANAEEGSAKVVVTRANQEPYTGSVRIGGDPEEE